MKFQWIALVDGLSRSGCVRALLGRALLGRVGALVSVGVLLSACERTSEAAPELRAEQPGEPATEPVSGSTGSVGTGQPALEPASRDNYQEDSFRLSLRAPGDLSVGKPAVAEVLLEVKDPYKVNQEYPIKLALTESAGLAFPASTVGKEAATLEAKKAVLKVPFTPKTAGEHKLAGRFSFSVCTDERCLIEKRELAVGLVVP